MRNAEAVGRVNKRERERREKEEARWRWRWRRKTRQEDCRSAGQDGLISAFRIRVVYSRGYYYFILLYYYYLNYMHYPVVPALHIYQTGWGLLDHG